MKPTKILEAQTRYDQAATKLERLDAALDQQRATLAEVTADDAELAELKRQRQRLLADHHLAEGAEADRLADEIAAHDRKLADRQAAADRIGDVLAGLEAERARLAEALVETRRNLFDAQQRHIVEVLAPRALDNYLKTAGEFLENLAEVLALQEIEGRFHAQLKRKDPEGARTRNVVKFLWNSDLPRPFHQFTTDRDLGPLPPNRPGYQPLLWSDSDLKQPAAAREQELLEELRQQGITVD